MCFTYAFVLTRSAYATFTLRLKPSLYEEAQLRLGYYLSHSFPWACPELLFLLALAILAAKSTVSFCHYMSQIGKCAQGQSCFLFWARLFGFSLSLRFWPNNLYFFSSLMVLRFKKLYSVRRLVLVAQAAATRNGDHRNPVLCTSHSL